MNNLRKNPTPSPQAAETSPQMSHSPSIENLQRALVDKDRIIEELTLQLYGNSRFRKKQPSAENIQVDVAWDYELRGLIDQITWVIYRQHLDGMEPGLADSFKNLTGKLDALASDKVTIPKIM